MTVDEVLAAAKIAGIRIAIDGDDLALEAEAAPPSALFDEMRSHKIGILARLGSAEQPPATSSELLSRLRVDVSFIEDEESAEREVAALLASQQEIGVDVETAARPEYSGDPQAALDPLRAEVRLLQLATESKALVIDLRKVPLSSPSVQALWSRTLVGHNLSFDAKMLTGAGVDLNATKIIDTIVLSGLFLRGEPNDEREGSRRPSLAIAAREALGIDLPKQMQKSNWGMNKLDSEQIAYAALDAVIARRLLTCFRSNLASQAAAPDGLTLADRLNQAVLPIVRMELNGVRLDRDALAALDRKWSVRIAQLRDEIRTRFAINNPNSAPQIAAWLAGELEKHGLRGDWPRSRAGQLSTQAKHLRRLIGIVPDIELLIELSHTQQLASNFGQKLLGLVAADGRLRANFKLAGAKTGRFTSSRPNLQNIPRAEEMRSLFVAEPGCMLVCADYNQLELRVMAAVSGDEVMRDAYRQGRDLHAITAAGMLGIGFKDFDKANPIHIAARKKAKAINFGIVFGCGPQGLREFARDAYDVALTAEEADDMIRRFLRTYKGVAHWMDAQILAAKSKGFVETIGGRRYPFAWEARGRFSPNLALNFPIQGTAAEIAIEAVARIDARLHQDLPTGRLVLQVHDEFVLEVPQGCEELAKKILVEEMSGSFSGLLPDAPVLGLVDAHAGLNWAAAKG